MQNIGNYEGRQIFWLEYKKFSDQLPNENWVCLAVSNNQPDQSTFDQFVRTATSRNILEFKAHGIFGEKLHDLFDDQVEIMQVMEGHAEIDIMTTWHNNQTLADAFWQCFFATCLPDSADFDNIKIVCTDLDGINRTEELQSYVKEFKLGWLPSTNVKHEVWSDNEGLTTLCLADKRGDDCRNLLDPDSKLIHSFYAASHYEAMTIYYKFMDWGVYTTEFEIDKEPYVDKIK